MRPCSRPACPRPRRLRAPIRPIPRRRSRASAIGRRSRPTPACVRRRPRPGANATTASLRNPSRTGRSAHDDASSRAPAFPIAAPRVDARSLRLRVVLAGQRHDRGRPTSQVRASRKTSPSCARQIKPSAQADAVRKPAVAPADGRCRRAGRAAQQQGTCRPPTTSWRWPRPISSEQSLPPNPAFSISRISGDGASEIERQVVGDILALATLPFRSDIARDRFRAGAAQGGAGDAAARRRRAPRLLSRGRRQRVDGPAHRREIDRGGNRGACEEARRDRRDQQARPGPRAGVLRRNHRRTRDRPPGRDQRAREARAPDGTVGRRSRIPDSGPRCRRCRAVLSRCPRSRPMPSAIASTCRSRAWSLSRSPSRSTSPKPRASSRCSMSPASTGAPTIPDARRSASAASTSSSKFRSSTAARCGSGRRPRPTTSPSTA